MQTVDDFGKLLMTKAIARAFFTNQSGNTQCSLVNSGHEGVADQSLGLSHSTFSN